jgi:hypothetical protein
MDNLYTHYYEENLSQCDSQRLGPKSFASTARKYRWNDRRFFNAVPKDAAILDAGCGVALCVRLLPKLLVYFSEGGWPGIISLNIICTARKSRHD